MPTTELKDKIAVVTGATAYIGRACAEKLAELGAHVVVSGRNVEAGAEVVQGIAKAGGKASFEAGDLFSAESMQAMAERVIAAHGRIDVLVISGAGASHDSQAFRLFRDMELEHYHQYIDSHWLSRVYALRAFEPPMRKSGGGSIVLVGTDAGRIATVGESMIGGATSGMMQMSRALARELGRDHIRVNVVSLSFVSDALPRWQSGSESLMSGHSNMLTQLKKRMLFDVRCSDIAEAVAFFAGPRSRAITGQTLSVNGGLSTPG
jgi:3-oxoacyl-[acyl-carrier protein] reductase